MVAKIEKLVVLGGGASGWIMANRLAKQFGGENGLIVELVESPNVKPVSVGEGTFPTMRTTLQALEIPEELFFRECEVTFKQTIRFDDWLHEPQGDKRHSYHHLFNDPRRAGQHDLSSYWLANKDRLGRYDHAVSEQSHICDRFLGPKAPNSPEYKGINAYAYHLNAVKFSAFLKRWATEKLGVKHTVAHIASAELAEDGGISALKTDTGNTIRADFFIDCTGFASYLIGKVLGVPFVDRSDTLFVDRALAVQVPYGDNNKIPSGTISTAKRDGWIWDIGLQTRRGVGYVYSSSHATETDAIATLTQHLGTTEDQFDINQLKFRVGHRQKLWFKNCVAVGFSGYFVEPLEATALFLVEMAATMLCDLLPPTNATLELAANKYNESMLYRGERIFDFLKLHYVLSRREDSDFWIENRDLAGVSDRLQANLAEWRYRMPSPFDFKDSSESHTEHSYKYILYGMDFQTQFSPKSVVQNHSDEFKNKYDELQRIVTKGINNLPSNRQLIDGILQYGIKA